MFFLGGLPALLALFVRVRVKESAVWRKSKEESWANLSSAILRHWRLFFYLVLLMTGMNLASHGTQDMYPTFLQRFWHFGVRDRSLISAVGNVGAMVGGTLIGLISDRLGRRRAIVIALLLAVLLVPLWAYAPRTAFLVAGAFLLQFCVQGAWGVIPAHLSELSPNSIRGFMPGFAYQCGVLLAGPVVYLEPLLAEKMSYATAMAATAAAAFVCTAIVAGLDARKRSRFQHGVRPPCRLSRPSLSSSCGRRKAKLAAANGRFSSPAHPIRKRQFLYCQKRIRLCCRLIGPIPLHSRETQGKTAHIARTHLNLIKRDLRNELWLHIHRIFIARHSDFSNSAVCQTSISSVKPLNVLPNIAKPPFSVSRAPKCRLLKNPRRRPFPHSAASITKSSVRACLILSQLWPRAPAAYKEPLAFAMMPSCPPASALARKSSARCGSPVVSCGITFLAGTNRTNSLNRRLCGSSTRGAPSS